MPGDVRDAGSIPGSGRYPEESVATHSSILAWRIPWTEEPGQLWAMGSQSQTRLKWLSTLGVQVKNAEIELTWWASGEESTYQHREHWFDPWSGKISHAVGVTKPVCHNYWACALEPVSCNCWAHVLQLLKPMCSRAHAPQQEKPPQWEAYALKLEKSPHGATKTQCSKK